MTSVRLNKDLEDRIEAIAQTEHVSKSDIIKTALENYCNEYFTQKTPYELGEKFFGMHGSGRKDGSKNYKKIIKQMINEKRNH